MKEDEMKNEEMKDEDIGSMYSFSAFISVSALILGFGFHSGFVR
jgi:hypothetical protein